MAIDNDEVNASEVAEATEATTEDVTVENSESTEETVVEVTTDEKQQAEIKKYYEEVDTKTKQLLDGFKETHINVVLEVFASSISIIGDTLDIPKIDLLNQVSERLSKNYPEQHPLIKVVSKEAGLQAGINFDSDTLFIMEDASIPDIDKAKATVYDIKSKEWVKNDYEVAEDKLEIIGKFYDYSYLNFKTEIIEQTEKNKTAAAEEAKVMKELAEEAEEVTDNEAPTVESVEEVTEEPPVK